MKLIQPSLSTHSTFILVLSLIYISLVSSQPPVSSSKEAAPPASTSPPSLLALEQRYAIYDQSFSEAIAESDLLEEDEDGEVDVVSQTEEPANSEILDEDFVVEPADLQSFAQPQEQVPHHLDSSSASAPSTSKFPILQDPRRAVEAAINEHFPDDQAAELRTALSRIRSRQGWPTPVQLEQLTVRIRAWQDVLLAELEAEGSLPEFARLFIQPAERYLAPVLSQYAWPPLYALERDGQYADSLAFGEGGTLSESIVERMGEIDSESIIGNLDVSYVSFPGSCTGQHPITRYFSTKQRSALDRFHLRIYREILQFPRIIVMNGGDVFTDLLLPLVAGGVFSSETVTLKCSFFNLETPFEMAFIRPPGARHEASSILIRRRHPQSLDNRSFPSLLEQLRADIASELLRGLAYRGEQLPPNRAFLDFLSRARSTNAMPGDSNDPLEPARTPWSYRLGHLARVERGMIAPLTIEGIRLLDFEISQIVPNILRNLPQPPPTAIPIPCPQHIAGSLLQQAQQRLIIHSGSTRSRTFAIKRKVKYQVALTPSEQQHLQEAEIRKQAAQKDAADHPKRAKRQQEARYRGKAECTDEQRARFDALDRISYQRRRAEMPPEVRAGMLEEQSLRSNVRTLNVVTPSDLIAMLAAGLAPPTNPNFLGIDSVASSSNQLPPIIGSSKDLLSLPTVHLPSSNTSTSLDSSLPPANSRPKPPPLPPRKPGSSKQKSKRKPAPAQKARKVEEEDEEEEEDDKDPAPSGKGKGVKRKKDDDPGMRKKEW